MPPTVPGIVRTTGVTATSISLAWTASSPGCCPVTSYDIWYQAVGSTYPILTNISAATAYTIPGLQPNTAYEIQVRARDGVGHVSAYSAMLTVSTTGVSTSVVATTGGNSPPLVCWATYRVMSRWPGGFTAEVTVENGYAAVTGWKVGFGLAAGQSVTQAWNATFTPASSAAVFTNLPRNGSVPRGGKVTFGILGTWTGSKPVPAGMSFTNAPCAMRS
ncbi:hypothetical protein GCM10009682_06200 [Luedemannella flava]|uniref:Fibronectin type III domain-containing protein n=2 Tax=Luedemannella flava TaxID=349316 RepID=A0ABP4XR30_9ACTN